MSWRPRRRNAKKLTRIFSNGRERCINAVNETHTNVQFHGLVLLPAIFRNWLQKLTFVLCIQSKSNGRMHPILPDHYGANTLYEQRNTRLNQYKQLPLPCAVGKQLTASDRRRALVYAALPATRATHNACVHLAQLQNSISLFPCFIT